MSGDSNDLRVGARARIIAAVTTPLAFFVLILLIAEGSLISGMLSYPDLRGWMLLSAVLILLVVLLIVAILTAWRPESLYFSIASLANSIGVNIFQAVEMYISNLEDEQERQEAYSTVIELIRSAEDPQHQRVRAAIGRVIQHQVDTLS